MLHAEAVNDGNFAAQLLLDVFGFESDAELPYLRAVAGARLLADACADLRTIRQALTSK